MRNRTPIILFSLVALLIAAMIVTLLLNPSRNRPAILEGSPDRVARLDMHDSTAAFTRGELAGTRIDPSGRIALAPATQPTPFRSGTWTSPEISTAVPLEHMVPSWNANTTASTGVRFEVSVRDLATQKWSEWLYIGSWGKVLPIEKPVMKSRFGEVDTDTLSMIRPADAYKVRAQLQSFDADLNASPLVRRIAVAYSGREPDAGKRAGALPKTQLDPNWKRSLPVPFRAQGLAPKEIKSSICSPTSVTMVMAYRGVDRPFIENAMSIYDSEFDLFGNWNRAVARAGELGLDAWLQFFNNWDEAKAMIAQGQPLIISIHFEKGEFPSNKIMDETSGHLIVIRGFTENGDVIVNDPASKDKGHGIIYAAKDLETAWLKNVGGLAYVIRGSGAAGTSPTTSTVSGLK